MFTCIAGGGMSVISAHHVTLLYARTLSSSNWRQNSEVCTTQNGEKTTNQYRPYHKNSTDCNKLSISDLNLPLVDYDQNVQWCLLDQPECDPLPADNEVILSIWTTKLLPYCGVDFFIHCRLRCIRFLYLHTFNYGFYRCTLVKHNLLLTYQLYRILTMADKF